MTDSPPPAEPRHEPRDELSWLDTQPPLARPDAETISLAPGKGAGEVATRIVLAEGAATSLPGGPLEAVGRFQVEGELGRGGMGVVYRVFDPLLNRRVALKITQRQLLGDREVVARFEAEAQITAQLQHPAIVPIHEIGRTTAGEVYYTMQLVEGSTLTDIVQGAYAEEPIHDERGSRFRLLQTFLLVCRAVDFAHVRGVLHRDLKPDNVMLGRFGQAYVMDWGVAKVLGQLDALRRLHQETARATRHLGELVPPGFEQVVEVPGLQRTQLGLVLGTPAFMAPEQAEGDPELLTPLADVYSLGGILYYILTGRNPHVGPPTAILRKVAQRVPPERPGSLRADVPAQLEEACLRALEYDPRQRTHSAEALATAVEAYLEGRSLNPTRTEDQSFLRSYSARIYRKPSLTVDVVLLAVPRAMGASEVLLIRRDTPPYQGAWALPGGFVRMEEDLVEAARRILREKAAGPPGAELAQIGAYGHPERDPRTRVITVAFLAVVDRTQPLPPAETEGAEPAWFRLDSEGTVLARPGEEPPEVAFDHARIVVDALRLVRWTRGTD